MTWVKNNHRQDILFWEADLTSRTAGIQPLCTAVACFMPRELQFCPARRWRPTSWSQSAILPRLLTALQLHLLMCGNSIIISWSWSHGEDGNIVTFDRPRFSIKIYHYIYTRNILYKHHIMCTANQCIPHLGLQCTSCVWEAQPAGLASFSRPGPKVLVLTIAGWAFLTLETFWVLLAESLEKITMSLS